MSDFSSLKPRHSVRFALACQLVLASWVVASSLADEIDFVAQIRPILHERCFACHGSLKQQASLRVDSANYLHQGGDSGPAIDIQAVEESELLLRIADTDESTRMPPEGKPLTQKEIALIKKWIQQGAKVPENDFAEQAPREHWAFQLPVKSLPSGRATGEKDHPVDRLLKTARRRAGLAAAKEQVPKRLLLRRVYIGLIGVPPTLAEMRAFEADNRPDAFERVVDHLLSQPQYGERWGRHWMDVWRYTDWYGLGAQLRNSQKHIWQWRDWIIDSLNDDQGYDQMIMEMLAADELFPTDPKRLRATGFLARNYYLFNRTTWLDSTIEHTGKAFLGLTFNCAKCHDHKYDPVTMDDYYQLRAIFEPHQVRLDPVPGATSLEMGGLPRVFDAHPDAKTYVHIRGNAKEPDKSKTMAPNVPAFFGYQQFQPMIINLPTLAHQPSLQPFVLADRLKELEAEIKKAESAFQAARSQYQQIQNSVVSKSDQPIDYVSFDLGNANPKTLFLNDDFSELSEKTWKIINGKWRVEDGKLLQSETGPSNRIVESVSRHPRDFLLELKMSVSGGQVWKSLGIRFDTAEEHEKTVYLSAYQDSKVQVSYATKGQTTYPTDGLAKIPVNLDTLYVLRVAVKGDLINVSVNGQHQVAYQYPVERRAGKIQLMSFDSLASFENIRMIELPGRVQLRGPGAHQQLTLKQAERKLRLAEARLKTAKLKKQAIRSGSEADQAKAFKPQDLEKSIWTAASDYLKYQHADKIAQSIETEIKLEASGEKEKGELKTVLANLNKQIKDLAEKFSNPGTKYESIRASQKALEGPDEKPDSRGQPYPSVSTGRRTAFARWIVDKKNPLTARVAVNQIWMRHFGQPLVDPVIDFGRRAKKPIQQPLLDWLAVDLIQNGWKMKRIHRLIVTSHAYRMTGSAKGIRVEPENRYYQVRSSLRMESQVVRDSLLRLSGQLEEKLGGPPVDPIKDSMSRRRSLYFRQSRDHQHQFVGMFDDADILRCYRRQESIIPQQALTLSNSRIAYEAAKKIATDISASHTDDQGFIRQAFELILCRVPAESETQVCQESLHQLKMLNEGRKDAKLRSRAGIVMGIFNTNDFVTIR